METIIEQTELLTKMATRKRPTPKPKVRTAKPRLLRSRTLPKLRKRRK